MAEISPLSYPEKHLNDKWKSPERIAEVFKKTI